LALEHKNIESALKEQTAQSKKEAAESVAQMLSNKEFLDSLMEQNRELTVKLETSESTLFKWKAM